METKLFERHNNPLTGAAVSRDLDLFAARFLFYFRCFAKDELTRFHKNCFFCKKRVIRFANSFCN